MACITDSYTVFYNDRDIGCYYTFDDNTTEYCTAWGCPWDIEKELKERDRVDPYAGIGAI